MNKSTLPFRGFDDRAPVRIYDHGILPHWRQEGCTYFVTFRLADSLPRPRLDELRDERDRAFRQLGVASWEEARRRLPAGEFLRLARGLRRSLEAGLDAGFGECLLQDETCRQIVVDALTHFHGLRVFTGDSVVMPNHVHALLGPLPGHDLEDILHSVKSYTSTKINRLLHRDGAVWQRESYDHIVRDVGSLGRIQEYIRRNPVKAGLPAGSYWLSTAEYQIR